MRQIAALVLVLLVLGFLVAFRWNVAERPGALPGENKTTSTADRKALGIAREPDSRVRVPSANRLGLGVRVLNADGLAVPDATLRCIPVWSPRLQAEAPDPRDLITDHSGVAWLDRLPPCDLRLVSEVDGLSGERFLRGDELRPGEVIDLILHATRTVAVTVVDQDGLPVSFVPVSLSFASHSSVRTDARGVALFHARYPYGNGVSFQPLVHRFSSTIRGELTNWNPSGTTRMTVKVKSMVTVHLRIQHQHGGPSPGDYTLRIISQDQSHRRTRRRTYAIQGSEITVAGGVPSDELWLQLEEKGRATRTKRITLPSRPGFVEVTMVRGKPESIVAVRLRSGDGQALAHSRLQIAVQYFKALDARAPSHRRKHYQTSDAQGLLQIRVPPDVPGILKLHDPEAPLRHGRPIDPLLALRFPGVPPGQKKRLADAVLAEWRVYVAGVVVTATGTPVMGAMVRLAFPGDDESFREVQSTTNNQIWNLRDINSKSDGAGRFTLFSFASIPSLRVFAQHGLEVSQEVGFSPGQNNLELRLSPSGGFTGKLPVAEDTGDSVPIIRFCHVAAAERSGHFKTPLCGSFPVRPDGTFLRQGLPAGIYRVEARSMGHTLFAVEGIEVRPGEINEDARLRPASLGRNLVRAAVTVIDSFGHRVEGAEVRITRLAFARRPKFGWSRTATSDASGRAVFLVEGEELFDVVTVDPKFGRLRRMERRLPTTVRFGSGTGLTLDLKVPEGLVLRAPHVGLAIELERMRGLAGWSPTWVTRFSLDETAPEIYSGSIRGLQQGRYAIFLRLHRSLGESVPAQLRNLDSAVSGSPRIRLGEVRMESEPTQVLAYTLNLQQRLMLGTGHRK